MTIKTVQLKDVPLNKSPSKLKTHASCATLAWYTYRAGIRTPPGPAPRFGTTVHSLIERWLVNGEQPRHANPNVNWLHPDRAGAVSAALAALNSVHLPKRLRPKTYKGGPLAMEHRFPDELVERRCKIPLRDETQMRGIIDWVWPDWEVVRGKKVVLVTDWKTTSGLKWALREEELVNDPQAITYSFDSIGTADAVRFRLIYVMSRPPYTVREVGVLFWRAELFQKWEQLQRDMAAFDASMAHDDPADVDYDLSACGNYGGCPFQSNCARLGRQTMGGLMSFMSPNPNTNGQEKKMGKFKRRAGAKVSSGGTGAVKPKAQPKKTTTKMVKATNYVAQGQEADKQAPTGPDERTIEVPKDLMEALEALGLDAVSAFLDPLHAQGALIEAWSQAKAARREVDKVQLTFEEGEFMVRLVEPEPEDTIFMVKTEEPITIKTTDINPPMEEPWPEEVPPPWVDPKPDHAKWTKAQLLQWLEHPDHKARHLLEGSSKSALRKPDLVALVGSVRFMAEDQIPEHQIPHNAAPEDAEPVDTQAKTEEAPTQPAAGTEGPESGPQEASSTSPRAPAAGPSLENMLPEGFRREDGGIDWKAAFFDAHRFWKAKAEELEGYSLHIDSVPSYPHVRLETILAPLMEEVEAERTLDDGPIRGHYGTISFNRGPQRVAQKLKALVASQGLSGAIVVSTSLPSTSACLEVLIPEACEIHQGVR